MMGAILLTWTFLGFAITLVIGFASDFESHPGIAMLWGWGWPILGPLWLVWKVLHWLIVLLTLAFRPVYQRVAQKRILAARCASQHQQYITGLMEENDDAYCQGLYGIYQPPTEWRESI
jgi:hypothetical protein